MGFLHYKYCIAVYLYSFFSCIFHVFGIQYTYIDLVTKRLQPKFTLQTQIIGV